LFLTTNRIETMDPAFQSRIQLAVEYKQLGINSRRKIWEAFIGTLPSQEERDELEQYIDVWKTHPLNGRQIRNVMNLARSLALNDVASGRTLGNEHVEQAIEETVKFQELFMGWENGPKRINKHLPRRKLHTDEYDYEDDG
jgi:AAA+ superfamily predicted ATPase